MTFGEKLKKLRKENGLTQEELAEKLYVTRTAVSKWETDKGFPAIDSLKLISELFQISLDELISDSDVENKRLLDERNARKMYWIAIGFLGLTAVFALLTWILREPLLNIGSIIGSIGCIVFGFLARPTYEHLSVKKRIIPYVISRVVVLLIVVAVMVGSMLQMS